MLTASQQDLFNRHFIGEEPIRSLAAELGCTENALHQRITVIRRRLKCLLRGRGIAGGRERMTKSSGAKRNRHQNN